MHPTPLLRTVRADLDWQELRFPGESELRSEIEKIPSLKTSLQAWSDPKRFTSLYPPSFLAGGMVATADFAPALYRVGVFLRRILRLDTDIEIHVFPSPLWMIDLLPHATHPGEAFQERVNWESATARDGRPAPEPIRLAVTATVAERLWAKETLFAVGRKLGRHLLNQIPLCADPSVGGDSQNRQVLLARGLWRFQELSCDRIGALCCQDSAAASRAILKSATGLPANLLRLDRPASMRMRLPEDEAMTSPWENDFIELRLVALQRFCESSLYQKVFDSPPIENKRETPVSDTPAPHLAPEDSPTSEPSILSFPPIEGDLGTLTSATETSGIVPFSQLPSSGGELSSTSTPPTAAKTSERHAPGSSEPLDLDRIRRTFTLNAALWLISQRDGVGDAEREALTDLFGPRFLDEVKDAYEERGPQVFEEAARSLAPHIAGLELDQRQSLLRDLIHVAMSAGRLQQSEHAWMVDLAGLIGITASQASLITAEFMDPEYADYEFRKGEDVEVLLDGEWMSGTVLDVDQTGDLKIEFTSDHDVLRLNPTADLIRPVLAKRA